MAGLDLPLAAISLMCFDVLCGHGCVSRAGACGIECLHGDWRGLGAVMSWVITHVCVSHGCLWNGASTWMLLFGPWNRSMQAQQPNRNRNAIFNNPPSLWGTRSRFRTRSRLLPKKSSVHDTSCQLNWRDLGSTISIHTWVLAFSHV